MFELLFQHISRHVSLTAEEWEYTKTMFVPKKLRRRQYLLQSGYVGEYIAFVNKGMLRSYTVDEKGEEHLVQFAPEGWWIGDIYSFLTKEPALYNIDALEEAELLLLSQEAQDQLFDAVPKFERYTRILQRNSLIAMHRRLVLTISMPAEEKYQQMLTNYPNLLQRVPQHMIASYLGVKPETLSRIRKRMAEGA